MKAAEGEWKQVKGVELMTGADTEGVSEEMTKPKQVTERKQALKNQHGSSH